jgi:hypothetical protein
MPVHEFRAEPPATPYWGLQGTGHRRAGRVIRNLPLVSEVAGYEYD